VSFEGFLGKWKQTAVGGGIIEIYWKFNGNLEEI
jgi:hypothetical protein